MDDKHLDHEQLREWAAEHGLEHLVDECADDDLEDLIEEIEEEARANGADDCYGERTESPRIC